MTYDTNLEAIEQVSTPELYLLISGIDIERYTSYNSDLNFQGFLYKSRSIQRSSFTMDQNFAPVEVTVTAPLTEIFTRYISNNPVEPATLTIYKAISTDLTDYAIIFKGVFEGIQINNRQAQARFKNRLMNLKMRLPKILYQSYCNWDVFDSDCKVSEGDHRVETVVTVSGATLTSTAFGAYSDGHFTAGRVVFGANERWVTNHVGNVLTLQVPFDSRLSTGSTVIAYPGCDGSVSTCKTKFNNFTNFLGMPYIPDNNPVIYGV